MIMVFYVSKLQNLDFSGLVSQHAHCKLFPLYQVSMASHPFTVNCWKGFDLIFPTSTPQVMVECDDTQSNKIRLSDRSCATSLAYRLCFG